MSLEVLRLPQLQRRVPLSRSRIYEMVAADEFPRPISLGPRAVGWLASEVDQWLRARVEDSRGTGTLVRVKQ